MSTSDGAAKSWVLVVDDDADFAHALASKLEAAGFRTQISGRVTEAVMKLKNQDFVCVLLDLKLEKGSGERVIEVLRSDPGFPNSNTAIFLMSGFLDASVLRRVGSQVNAVLVKPFDVAPVIEKIRQLVRELESLQNPEGAHGEPSGDKASG